MLDERHRVPEGVADLMPEECARGRDAEEAILRRFSLCGYEQVRTPVLEYFSLFQGDEESAIVKTFDRGGRILALRPECTTPIARLVSTRLKDAPLPLRLCYLGLAFDNRPGSAVERMEFTQAGAELYGLSQPEADAEVIALAAASLEAAGLRDYLIDVGQVDFFKGLMEEAGLDEQAAERIRVVVEEKNSLAMEMLLLQSGVGEEARKKLMSLPSLYGGKEVIAKARGMTRSGRCQAALDNLCAVYEMLEECGYGNHVTIDLGMVHSIHYYTGVIFRGISDHLGAPILSGGRYDRLLEGFGMPCPATGFALGVERLLEALQRQGGVSAARGVDIVAGFASMNRAAMEQVEAWRGEGLRVELFCGEQQEAEAMARVRGARLRWIGEGGERA